MYVLIVVYHNTLYVLVCKVALLTLSSKVQQCYMVVSHWSQLYMIMSLIIYRCVTQFYWFISVFSAMYATDGRSERRTFIDLDYKHPNLNW